MAPKKKLMAGWQTREEALEGETHKECFVWWLDVVESHADAFDRCLARAKWEEDVRSFFERILWS
jgi:hypothetical protein